jgi:hypothetical protein
MQCSNPNIYSVISQSVKLSLHVQISIYIYIYTHTRLTNVIGVVVILQLIPRYQIIEFK